MPSLKQSFSLSWVEGEIVAIANLLQDVNSQASAPPITWYVSLTISDSDRRYIPATCTIMPKHLRALQEAFEQALKQMLVLEGKKFSGQYSRVINYGLDYPRIEVTGISNHIYMKFTLKSSTGYLFTRDFTKETLESSLAILQDIEHRAARLVEDLSELL